MKYAYGGLEKAIKTYAFCMGLAHFFLFPQVSSFLDNVA